jgi:hypothetical protein
MVNYKVTVRGTRSEETFKPQSDTALDKELAAYYDRTPGAKEKAISKGQYHDAKSIASTAADHVGTTSTNGDQKDGGGGGADDQPRDEHGRWTK